MLCPTTNSVAPMDSTPEMSVKIVYNGEMRRFPFTGTSFQALNNRVLEVLGLESSTPVVLKYRDEDNDLVTITNDVELKTAIVPGKVLRLEVFPTASTAIASPAPSFDLHPFIPGQVPAQHPGPMMFPPFFGRGPFAGPCMGKEAWHKYKKEMKDKKKSMSPEEWAAFKAQFKQSKEQHRHAKEHMKGFHKMMKKGYKHDLRAAMFGPGPHHGHGPHHGLHPHFHRGGHRGHHFGPRFGHPFMPHGPHHGPQDTADDAAAADGATPSVPPQPGFAPPFAFGHHHPFFGHPHLFHQPGEKLVARHVKDVSIEDGTVIPAGTQFVKTWRVRNEGSPWPAGCRLTYNSCDKHKGGDNMSGPEFVVIENAVATNEEVDISVPLVAPTKPGRYTGYWKMRTPDARKFGQRLWVTIKVPSNGSSSSSEEEREADRYEALVDSVLAMGFNVKRHRVFRLLQKFNGNVDQVALKLAHKQEKAEKRASAMIY